MKSNLGKENGVTSRDNDEHEYGQDGHVDDKDVGHRPVLAMFGEEDEEEPTVDDDPEDDDDYADNDED